MTNPAQSFYSWVKGILLLSRIQWAPNHPLLSPPKVHERAHSTRLPQRTRPHTRSSFLTTTPTSFLAIAFDHPVQGDQLTTQLQTNMVYCLPIPIPCITFLIMNKMLFYAPSYRNSSYHCSTSNQREHPTNTVHPTNTIHPTDANHPIHTPQ